MVVISATSTVLDGNMDERFGEDAIANRQQFLTKMGLSDRSITIMRVTHGNLVSVVSPDIKESWVDGLITYTPGHLLGLLTADCVPLMMYGSEVVSLIHVGWASADLGIIEAAFSALRQRGYLADELNVRIGPAIKASSYVQTEPHQLGDPRWSDCLYPSNTGQGYQVDLVKFCQTRLIAGGVQPDSISADPVDTATDERYYSHSATRAGLKPAGRMLTIAGIIGV